MTISVESLVGFLEKGGLTAIIAMLLYLVLLLIKGDVIGIKVHDRIVAGLREQLAASKEDCEFFRQIAFRNSELAERTIGVVAPDATTQAFKHSHLPKEG